jgi:hypothetical protein
MPDASTCWVLGAGCWVLPDFVLLHGIAYGHSTHSLFEHVMQALEIQALDFCTLDASSELENTSFQAW